MTLLSVEGLTKRFGGLVAVDELSFEVEEGEILGLIGPNGSGKTTAFNCIMSTYGVTGGTIRFDDEVVTDWRTHEIVDAGLARVSQESNPIERMTVAENIRLFTLPNSVLSFTGGASREEIREIASRVEIEDHLDDRPDELPHAGVRRLEIAKALATGPDLLLLDEPFAGMNRAEMDALGQQLLAFRDEGITQVVVDHNMHGLLPVVDRVVVLYNGQLLAEGPPQQISEDERVQEAYLAGTEVT